MKFRCGLSSFQPQQNFISYKSFTITFYILQFTFRGFSTLGKIRVFSDQLT